MIPVTDELFDAIQAALPDEDERLQRFEKLSAPVAWWARNLSASGMIAYIEAEFFGGVGGQSAVAWRDGEIILGPVHSEDAINIALRLFGVEVGGEFDEFDAVGLGLHRSNEEWLTGNTI
jgi:hypothetical protein